MRIDVHAHAFPSSFLRDIARRYPSEVELRESALGLTAYWAGAPLPEWNEAVRLAEMDRDGVSLEVLSAPVVYAWNDAGSVEVCAQLNDFQSALALRHPERFASFLHLPVHAPDLVRGELDRWEGHAEIAGAVIASNMAGTYPGDSALVRVWDMLVERDLAVFVHPISPARCFGPVAPPLVLFPCDTTIAAASIIYSGLFERHPNVRIILSHYGGVLPMLARRLDMGIEIAGFPAGHGQGLAELPSRAAARFWVDTAQGYHAPAFACARAMFGLEHMLYGSDHFFPGATWRSELNRFLDQLGLDEGELSQLVSGNARSVLRGLRSH